MAAFSPSIASRQLLSHLDRSSTMTSTITTTALCHSVFINPATQQQQIAARPGEDRESRTWSLDLRWSNKKDCNFGSRRTGEGAKYSNQIPAMITGHFRESNTTDARVNSLGTTSLISPDQRPLECLLPSTPNTYTLSEPSHTGHLKNPSVCRWIPI